MKKRFYIKTALSLMSIALLSSCLKDSKYAVNFQGATPLVELPGAANVSNTAGPFEVVGLVAKATGTSPFNVAVNLASPHTLSTGLTVKLSVDAAALAAYNNSNEAPYKADSIAAVAAGTDPGDPPTLYRVLPAADYNSTLSVTIPAGQNLANVVVNVNTSAVDPTQSYVLPLTITDGGGQKISNYKTILYAITIKNAFDDNYTETGYKFHTNPTASHAFTGNTIPVATVNAVTSQTAVGDLGGSGYVYNFDTNGATVSNWVVPTGAATPLPPASGFMTADFATPGGVPFVTPDGSGSQPGKSPYTSATYNNTYTASTKTFFLHYGYGVGTTTQADYSRVFYIKLVGQ